MELLTKTKSMMQRLTFYVCYGSMFMLIPMMFLTSTDVIGRRFFDRPISGAVELSEYMLVVVILLGLAYTQQVKGHPKVTLVTSRLPVLLQAVLEIVMAILGILIISIVIWQGWVLATGRMSTIVSDVLRIPQLPFRLLVSVGGALFLLELLVDLAIAVAKIFNISSGSKKEKAATQVK